MADYSKGFETQALELPGWRHLYSGKVRDLYEPADTAPGQGEGNLLVVASDRISAYDFVLDTEIPDKGTVLTQLSLWWFEQLQVPHHVVSLDVPEAVAGRAMVVQRLQMYEVECIARGYLTGSGLAEYRESGTVTGLELPAGLVDGSKLEPAIFTPSAKAEVGEHPGRLHAGRGHRPGARDHPGGHQGGVRTERLRADRARRRGAHPGLLAVLGCRGLRAGALAALLRQAVRARLVDRPGVRLGPRLR